MRVFVCSTNRVFSGEKKLCVCSTNLGFSMIPGTSYVPDTYVPGISRQKSIRTYVMFLFLFPFLFQHGTPTFLVTKVLGICVRSFIRREKENPPEILYTKRDSPGGLLNSGIFNFQTRYTAKTQYTFACQNIARPAADSRPDQLQKRVLPALFHLRCPSQSHQRSARGRTRLTTVTSISSRSL